MQGEDIGGGFELRDGDEADLVNRVKISTPIAFPIVSSASMMDSLQEQSKNLALASLGKE